MAWITPKTNWKARYNEQGEYIGDYFNVEDYNRIINNLCILKDLYIQYNKPSINFETFTVVNRQSLAYAEDFNKIERNLEQLLKNFSGLNNLVGKMKKYVNNGRTIDYAELNRIEKASLGLYEVLPREYRSQRYLEFSLGLDNIGEFSTIANGG